VLLNKPSKALVWAGSGKVLSTAFEWHLLMFPAAHMTILPLAKPASPHPTPVFRPNLISRDQSTQPQPELDFPTDTDDIDTTQFGC